MTKTLSIAFFNAENFSLLLDKPYDREELEALDQQTYLGLNPSIYNPNKDRRKIAAIASTILENDFDLVGLCEVGGLETLESFNRIYLDGRYICILHEENSKRGIFVGALLRKGMFPRARGLSMSGDFSRNLLKLELGEDWQNTKVFIVHLKSQHGEDRGIAQRIGEIERLAALVGPRRCLVMGDFNGILIRGMHQFEYERFLELPLTDVLAAVGIPPKSRHTHYYFGDGRRASQLDYIFCTHDIEVLDAGVIEDDIPSTREERRRLPSDHLFIRARIEIAD